MMMAETKYPGKSKGTLTLALKHGEADVFQSLANPRPFRTGSEGYSVSGKMTGTDGNSYQVSVNVIRIGSDGEGPDAEERKRVALVSAKAKLEARTKAIRK